MKILLRVQNGDERVETSEPSSGDSAEPPCLFPENLSSDAFVDDGGETVGAMTVNLPQFERALRDWEQGGSCASCAQKRPAYKGLFSVKIYGIIRKDKKRYNIAAIGNRKYRGSVRGEFGHRINYRYY